MIWPKISVVTPSYNQRDFLEETILSVLNQRYPNLEYIVIDDGSTDGSLEITKKYADRLAHWETGPNQGQTRAINKGFRRVTGDIVAYINSDDVYLPGAFHRVAEEFTRDPACEWLSGQYIFFGGPDARTNKFYHCKVPAHVGDWFAAQPIAQPATFWRRELMEKHGLLDESYNYCMDYEYFMRFAVAGEICKPIQHPICAYRLHVSSKTVSQPRRFEIEDQRLKDAYLPRLNAREAMRARQAMKRQASICRHYRACDLLHQGKRSEAWREMFGAWKQHPSSMTSRSSLGAVRRLLFTGTHQ